MVLELHSEFIAEMRAMLKEEYPDFAACMHQSHLRGIRINTLKFRAEDTGLLNLPIRKCPFSDVGYYLDSNETGIGNSPWHHAGAIYSQEPSAMSAVTVLDPQPGDKILDMCAAPGGKTTQIAAALEGKGLLWSNEYIRKRAQILLSNVERMGIRNCVVSNAHPDAIAQKLKGFFNRVLVDAPCSGEGMFRKDERAVEDWSPEHSAACAVRQSAILDSAAECLCDGGILVYSTCTFSFCENEDTVAAFLDRHPDFILEPCRVPFGRDGFDRSEKYDLTLTRRVFPMDGGEGHFVARFKKLGDSHNTGVVCMKSKHTDDEKRAAELFTDCFHAVPYGPVIRIGENCFILPELMPDVGGLGILRGGVLLGEIKKKRIEPSHALFMAAQADECSALVSLQPDSADLAAFLHGEEISVDESLKGYAAVACRNTITGFGKCSYGRLKNRYPKGLRNV